MSAAVVESGHNDLSDEAQQQQGTQDLQQEVPKEEEEMTTSESPHFTWRAVAGGIVIGCVMCFSNMYFGLQTGWVTMGSLQSSVLGYGLFRLIAKTTKYCQNFTPIENVLLQTTAVACATMPLAGGFVGIIPALAQMEESEGGPVKLSFRQQFLWALALAFFGVFFAVPLRTQTILREKLRFPSAIATAAMIRILHRLPEQNSQTESEPQSPLQQQRNENANQTTQPGNHTDEDTVSNDRGSMHSEQHLLQDGDERIVSEETPMDHGSSETEWRKKWIMLGVTFGAAGIVTLLMHFFTHLENIKLFSWVGLQAATQFKWTITPSGGYLGQGMIMGPRVVLSMLFGSILGWAIIGPVSKSQGWAPGDIDSWENGAKGFITWVSLAIMLADSLTGLTIISFRILKPWCMKSGHEALPLLQKPGELQHSPSLSSQSHVRQADEDSDEGETHTQEIKPFVIDPAPIHHQVPTKWWVIGLIVSTAGCVAIVTPLFNMKVYEPLIAVVFALLVAVLAVRALGETDLNPVSGVGKLSQAVFAGISPGNVLSNLLAGAIAEAGAQQAGDMMQDLKTGHLLRASPRAQFFAQLIGSLISVFFTLAAYWLYTTAYEVPGPVFQVPTAAIWLDMARIVNGKGLPEEVAPVAACAAILAVILALCNFFLSKRTTKWLPSGIAIAVGMYVTPNWTIARVVGGMFQLYLKIRHTEFHDKYLIIIASGLVLGEGMMSIVTASLKAGGY